MQRHDYIVIFHVDDWRNGDRVSKYVSFDSLILTFL